MTSGLGLDDFLKYDQTSGRKFLGKWKDTGEIVIWLHRASKKLAWTRHFHGFYVLDTRKNKKTNEDEEYLRYVTFVSPDSEEVCLKQYFREDRNDKRSPLQVPPVKDPFLLLREWLRREIIEGRLATDQVVFEWENPAKNNELTQWCAGRLAKLVEKDGSNWSASLDAQLEYIFVVVDNEHPSNGLQITREKKSLGEAMKACIKAEIDSNGIEEGNPLVTPYAFKWIFDKKQPGAKMYAAHRFNRADYTDEIALLLDSPEYPDPSRDTFPRPGDKSRIKAAMLAAARIDLPLDEIFVDEWEDDTAPGAEFDPSQFSDDAPSKSRGRPADVSTRNEPTPGREGSAGRRKVRQKKKRVKKPERPAWDVPANERDECEECGMDMHPSWDKCPKCQTEYEVDDGVAPPPLKTILAQPGWSLPDDAPGAADSEESGDDSFECFSCQADIPAGASKCPNCGIDIDDDIPFG